MRWKRLPWRSLARASAPRPRRVPALPTGRANPSPGPARPSAFGHLTGALHLLAPLVVVLVPWLFLGPLWWGEAGARRYLPEGDLSSQYYPLRAYASSRLARGELPLWNPYALGGQPGLADIQASALYPPQSLQSLALGGDLRYVDLEMQVPVHLALAALGAYYLAWRLSRSRWGGVTAGLAYGIGGYLTSFPVQQLTILCTAAWLPWLLLGIERLAAARRPLRHAAALAVLVAMTALAGHPQTALLVAYLVAAYAVWRLWARPQRWRLLALTATAGCLGGALAAVQLLPTLEFISLSTRSSLSVAEVSGGFGLHEVAGFLYPGYFGGTPQYVGAATLATAGLALAALPWRRSAFWVATAALGLLLSFGGSTALYYVAYICLPGYSASRNQERAILLTAFALAVLAGYGVAVALPRLLASPSMAEKARRRFWWATGAAVAFAVVLYAGTRLPAPASGTNLFGGILKQHVWVLMAVAVPALVLSLHDGLALPTWAVQSVTVVLIAANLWVVNYHYNLGDAPAAATRPSADVAATLRAALGAGERLASGGLLAEGPSAGMIYGIPDTSGNTPLQLDAYSRFVAAVPEWRQWQLLAVSHVVLPAGASPAPGMEPVLPGATGVYRLPEAPRPARLVHTVARASGEGAIQALAQTSYNPATMAVADTALADTVDVRGDESATVLDWRPERIDVEVRASAPGLLVLSQLAYPGWRATVDGAPVKTLSCDAVLTCVEVEPGRHIVRLEYWPASVIAGAVVTGIAAVCVLLMASGSRVLPRC